MKDGSVQVAPDTRKTKYWQTLIINQHQVKVSKMKKQSPLPPVASKRPHVTEAHGRQLNDDYHEDLTLDAVDRLLDGLE